MLPAMVPERVVRVRVRTLFTIAAFTIAIVSLLMVISIARQVLIWILIALFFAVAMNPLVELIQRRGIPQRGLAVAATFVIVLSGATAIGATFIPTLIDQVGGFADNVPEYVDDVTRGDGPLGFLETKYQLGDKIDKAINDLEKGGPAKVLGHAGAAVSVTKSIVTLIVAIITIVFLTFFMLLEGRAWVERFYGLLSPESQPRWRKIGLDIYRAVGGYVVGNLLISLIAGTLSTIVLLATGVPYAVALGLLVALLDLIPLAGATLAAILVTTIAGVATGSWTTAIIVLTFFLIYQQLENHVIQPLIYGRTVQLSPLVVLISVLIGAELAGILGALAAIPVAGALQVIIVDQLAHRKPRQAPPPDPDSEPAIA
jgi:predicted PurR-regulated permease PerM